MMTGAHPPRVPRVDRNLASSPSPTLFGVLGDPVDHSLSPAMHNAAFAATGLPHVYLRYRVPPQALAAALDEARALGMGGLNLTIPLKEVALGLVDRLTPAAQQIGAVNTIIFERRGDRLVGDNTDARGFMAAIRGRMRLRGQTVVILGAGGSARAIGTALAHSGCARLVVANRTAARGERLASRLADLGGTPVASIPLSSRALPEALGDAVLVVNTTPAGLAGASLPVDPAATSRQCLFVDLVYGARPSRFLARAARARRRTLDGSLMLLHQGALAFEAWTGRAAPRVAMARALRAAGLTLTEPHGAASVSARRPPRS
jgi:shikimate dehydrogenase